MVNLAWLIPAASLVSFLLIVFVMRRDKETSGWVAIAGVSVGFVISLLVLQESLAGGQANLNVSWLTLQPGTALPLGMRVDPLAAVMLVVVTSISLMVQVYSRGYMRTPGHDHGRAELDPGYSRFFAFLALFTFSMLGLVLANNLLTIYLFWEGVGLGSYLLIGFWHDRGPADPQPENPVDQRPSPAEAAKKAFVTTRFGDFGFLVGILFVWMRAGTFDFAQLGEMVKAGQLTPTDITIASVLIFAGAVGKSAQFPLHVWLPDAMEGPTPVSALIHAATMVAAGVYLVARMLPIFSGSETAMAVVAAIGGFTALFAATMGLVAFDIKRVMAYSTVSQLGYMMLALGSGSLAAGIFHLFNHAFFKALLFLTAGSVIHSTDSQDIRQLGGLWRVMPITGVTMVIAALSLAGLPPFSGFWSKDEVLLATLDKAQHGGGTLYWVLFIFAMLTVFLTAFYMFRVVFMTFSGSYRGHGHRHGESPPTMAIPLIILAVPSVISGFWGAPFLGNPFGQFLHDEHHAAPNLSVAGLSVLLALAGLGLAWAMYYKGALSPERVTSAIRPLYLMPINKYWLDDLYNRLIGVIVIRGSALLATFDLRVIDGIVNGIARATAQVGGTVRLIQTGRVQSYALAVFGGLVIIAFFMVIFRVR